MRYKFYISEEKWTLQTACRPQAGKKQLIDGSRDVFGSSEKNKKDHEPEVTELHTRHPFMGSRSLRDQLSSKGYIVNRKRVRRLMIEMNIHSTAPKPNTSKPGKQPRKKHGMQANKIYPYLLRNLTIDRPNQVWTTDISVPQQAERDEGLWPLVIGIQVLTYFKHSLTECDFIGILC